MGRVPLRLGEIWSAFLAFPLANRKRIKLDRWEQGIIFFLFFNLFVTILGVCLNYDMVVRSFAYKYIARNILNLVFFAGFLASGIVLSSEDIGKLFKYMIGVQGIMYLFHIMVRRCLVLGEFANQPGTVELSKITIIKVYGTCMEPGYLATLLPLALYYFLQILIYHGSNKKKRMSAMAYVAITLVLAGLTFSTAVYALIVLTLAVVSCRNSGTAMLFRYMLYGFATAVVAGMTMFNGAVRGYFEENVVNKIGAYLLYGTGKFVNYSGGTRGRQLRVAIDWFINGTFLQKLTGRGTGAYWEYSKSQVNVYYGEDVSEAYNLYVSTMTDRGLMGLVCIMGVLYCAYKLTDKKDWISKCLFWGIVIQGLHWTLTGNFWLYYFWHNLAFIAGYNRFKFRKSWNKT